MVDVVRLHTSELDADTRAAARELLYAVFDDMTEHDWEHSLGGVHALVMDGAPGSSVTRPSSSGGCCTAVGRCARATSRASRCTRSTAGAGTAAR